MQSSKRPQFDVGRLAQTEPEAQALLNLRCAVDRCHDAVFITDRAGRIEFVNPSFEALSGYSRQEAANHDLGMIVAEDGGSAIYETIRKEVVRRGLYRGTQQFRRKNGTRFDMDLAVTGVRNAETRAMSLVYAGRDITELQTSEAELRRARKTDAMGVVAGGIAHDFNNFLMVISAHAELGLSEIGEENPLRRHLQEILGASRRAAELTHQLLVFGRGRLPGLRLLALNSVVEDVCRVLPAVIGEDVELQIALGRDLEQVRADPGQIEQALLNLAINGRDAMPNGGRLLIETRSTMLNEEFTRNVSGASPGAHILLAVTDSGQGIQTEELPRIFEPFYTTKAEGKGTGLGLAMVNSVVKQNGGFISVDSVPGFGSTFNIYFPASIAPLPEGTVRAEAVPFSVPRGVETLLVVEDEIALRECMVEFLASIGYQVQSVPNGKGAMEIGASAKRVDLVISDVVLPDMNGPKLVGTFNKLQPQPKVLFMSGHAESVALRKGVSDLDHHFLQKPFSLQMLATKIREVLAEPVVPGVAVGAAVGKG